MTEKMPQPEENPDFKSGGFIDKNEYLKSLTENSGIMGAGRLDRSEFFRHKEDYKIFETELSENEKNGEPLTFLQIGIGNMEEPTSYLAVAYSKLGKKELEPSKEKKLSDIVDMHFVEIRDAGELNPRYNLGKQLFDKEKPIKPKAYKESFALNADGEYEPNEEIKNYLTERMKDTSKAHLGTPIENFTRTNDRAFHIVSCNNVIQHLGGIEEYPSPYKNPKEQSYDRYYEELARILDLVKEGGIIFIHAPAPGAITDTKSRGTSMILNNMKKFSDDFEEITSGVYRRKIKKEHASLD